MHRGTTIGMGSGGLGLGGQAAPFIVAAGAGAAGTTELAVPFPSGLVASDFLILQVGSRTAGTMPDDGVMSALGFLRLFPAAGEDSFSNARQALWRKFASGSE